MKAGEIVLVPIPFTDQSSSKKRPCLILKHDANEQDCIVLPITSKNNTDKYLVQLQEKHFIDFPLPKASFVKTNKVFTLHEKLILKKITSISPGALQQMLNSFVAYIEEL